MKKVTLIADKELKSKQDFELFKAQALLEAIHSINNSELRKVSSYMSAKFEEIEKAIKDGYVVHSDLTIDYTTRRPTYCSSNTLSLLSSLFKLKNKIGVEASINLMYKLVKNPSKEFIAKVSTLTRQAEGLVNNIYEDAKAYIDEFNKIVKDNNFEDMQITEADANTFLDLFKQSFSEEQPKEEEISSEIIEEPEQEESIEDILDYLDSHIDPDYFLNKLTFFSKQGDYEALAALAKVAMRPENISLRAVLKEEIINIVKNLIAIDTPFYKIFSYINDYIDIDYTTLFEQLLTGDKNREFLIHFLIYVGTKLDVSNELLEEYISFAKAHDLPKVVNELTPVLNATTEKSEEQLEEEPVERSEEKLENTIEEKP